MLVPYNDPDLSFAIKNSLPGAAASPFVVAMINSGISGLPGLINGCILLFVISAANSDLYISSRTLYSLSREGNAPRIFSRTNRAGVPVYSLAVSGLLACIAFLNVSNDSKTVFGYLVNLTTIFGILTWISILVSHIFFVRARKAQNLTKDRMPYTAPLGIWGSYSALVMCILITLFKNFDVFVGGFDYKNFITGYLGIPLYLVLILGYKIVMRSPSIPAKDVDLFGGKEAFDEQEKDFLATKAHRRKQPGSWFYRHFIAWLL